MRTEFFDAGAGRGFFAAIFLRQFRIAHCAKIGENYG